MESYGVTWSHMESYGVNGITWNHMESFGVNRVTWSQWSHIESMESRRITWSQWNLGIIKSAVSPLIPALVEWLENPDIIVIKLPSIITNQK